MYTSRREMRSVKSKMKKLVTRKKEALYRFYDFKRSATTNVVHRTSDAGEEMGIYIYIGDERKVFPFLTVARRRRQNFAPCSSS